MLLTVTPNLIIREVRSEDFKILHAIYTQPENMQFISSGRYNWTEEEIKEKYKAQNIHYPDGYGLFVVEHKLYGVIGEAGLFNSFHTSSILELGYILDKTYWGKGYGTAICRTLIEYCFRQLNTEKVVARMYAGNTASVKVSEKTGMKRVEEGTTPDGRSFYRYEISKENLCTG